MAHSRVWDASYEALPADTDDANTLGLRDRNTRTDIRERMEVDHDWDDVDDAGQHIKVTLMEQGADPTVVAGSGHLYTKDSGAQAELFWQDEGGNVIQLTAGGLMMLPRGYIDGIIMAPDTAPTTDILFGAGSCTDSTNTLAMHMASLAKQIDNTWAAGDDAGGMNDGETVAADTWYHCFALASPNGDTLDFGFDTSLTAAGLLADTAVIAAGLTKYRRVGSVKTLVGAATIKPFHQRGDDFIWDDITAFDLNTGSPATARTSLTVTTPLGVSTRARLHVGIDGGNHAYLLFLSPGTAAGFTNPDHNGVPLAMIGDSGADSVGVAEAWTDTSSQIIYEASVAASWALYVATAGYHDPRGKDA